jgi:hypothetical protein
VLGDSARAQAPEVTKNTVHIAGIELQQEMMWKAHLIGGDA